MGNTKRAIASAGIELVDLVISQIPDPQLKLQLSLLSFAVKIPYAFLKELFPQETDDFLKLSLNDKKITEKIILSTEFQQALGSTLENLRYIKEKEKRDLIKKIFLKGYLDNDEYARNSLERLQNVSQQLSLDALRHLLFIKETILPFRDRALEKLSQKGLPIPGFSLSEFIEIKKRTEPISKYYDSWHSEIKKEAQINNSDMGMENAKEQKRKNQFSEIWSEFNSLGIFKQGNDPTIGTYNGGSGTVQYLTEFGENLIIYLKEMSNEKN